jgi:D-amino-acid dehydrogenase
MDGYRPLLAETAAAALVQSGGLLTVYGSEAAFAADGFAHGLRARRGVKLNVLDGPAIERLEPALGGRFSYAIHTLEPFFTPDPQRFGSALAESFITRGGSLVHGTVVGFERTADHVTSVITNGGAIRTDSVVISAGVWSSPLAKQLGLRVPLIAERGYGVEIPDPGVGVDLPVIFADLHVGFRSNASGLVVMGIDELASVAAAPRYSLTERLIKAARQVFPNLRTDGAAPWMHCRPSLPDSLPMIGRAPGYRNAYLAFGHGHKGLGLAGITARLVQELIDGTSPSVDLAPFSPIRFTSDGRM